MVQINYSHEFNYRTLPSDGLFAPAILVGIGLKDPFSDFLFCIDTGSSDTIAHPDIATALGLKISKGVKKIFNTNSCGSITAYGHRVKMFIEDDLDFDLLIFFPESAIERNLLGRDFLKKVQIGFRENQGKFYLLAQP